MDVNNLRIAVTLAVVRHLPRHRWPGPGRARNRARFDEAARLPFADDDDERERAMSDFFNDFWSIYVAVAHAGRACSPAWCCSSIASRRKPMAADNTTGHVWDDDLREMNNPMPRWWMWLFVLTIVFALAYLAAVSRAWAATPAQLRLDQPRRVRSRAGAAAPSMATGLRRCTRSSAGRGAGRRRARRWPSASACS